MTQPSPPDPPPPFDAAPAVLYLDTDCFCGGCGYLMRGQPVRREPHTGVFMARCPECGRYEPATLIATAGRMWLNRLTTWLTALWVFAVIAATLIEGLIVYGITMAASSSMHSYFMYTYSSWRSQIVFLVVMACIVAGLGFASAVLSSVIFPHWRWSGYPAFAVLKTLVIAGAVAGTWASYDEPSERSLGWIAALALILVYGPPSVLGGVLGRILARAVATLVLPRRVRAALGYLWMVDGYPPPHAERATHALSEAEHPPASAPPHLPRAPLRPLDQAP